MVVSCRERYQKILAITRLCASVVGADITDKNYRVNWLTWLVIVSTSAFFCCTGYTIYVGVVVDDDWTVILQALAVVGSAVQGFTKLFSYISKRELVRYLASTFDEIYLEYEKKRKGYRQHLNNTTALVNKMMKAILAIYVIGITIIMCYPILAWVIWKRKVFVLQFLLPGIDRTTDIGHLLHISSHCLCLCFGGFGNFAGDMFVFIFITHVPMMKDILRSKFEDLNEILLKTHDSTKTLPLLVDIVRWHQMYTKYKFKSTRRKNLLCPSIEEKIEEVFFAVIMVEIFTISSGICCTLFCLVLGVWPAAFAYLVYSIVILYVYCGLGTLVEIANDEFTDSIYNDCRWYEMSVPEQKLIIMMLKKSQTPKKLTVANIMPLSVATALQMTKAIYTYMMMLLNFVDAE